MKFLITGSICNLDISFGELLVKHGHRVSIVRSSNEPKVDFQDLAHYPKYVTMDDIKYISGAWHTFREIRSSEIVISISAGIIGKFGRFWMFAPLFVRKPLISVASGSDLSELVMQKSALAATYRWLLGSSVRIITHPFPMIVKNLRELDLMKKTSNIPYPLLFSDTKKVGVPPHQGPLRILHATNLDWGVTDAGSWRNSSKGNDIFIAGILDALKQGADIECLISYRGPDREIAKRWIDGSGFSEKFQWIGELNQLAVQKLMAEVDLVVDQFTVGAFGLIALEAMSLGKPVLLRLDDQYLQDLYPGDEQVPVINHANSEEIANFLAKVTSDELRYIGLQAREWALRNHDIETATFTRLFELVEELSASSSSERIPR